MNLFDFIPPYLYGYIYVLAITILCAISSIYYSFSPSNHIINNRSKRESFYAIIISIVIIMFLGPRPVHIAFVDTGYYVFSFLNANEFSSFSFSDEWLWNNFEYACHLSGMPSELYLLLIEFIYVCIVLIVCVKVFPNRPWLALLFFLSSFSFYGYAVNGLRNGMACHIVLLAIVCISGKYYEKFVAIILMLMAYGIHRSTAVPVLCALISLTCIKRTSSALFVWVSSIIISLVVGNLIGDFFNSLGLFEEKSNYFLDAEHSENSASFSSTGFRFDFLIYSAIPVLMVWYLTIKRNFIDSTYNIIANTYILSNAFWIIVIRAAYSNRFAYLSWFLYPLVIVYPLLRMNIWEDQDRKTAIILLAYSGFTFFMSFVYYAK